MKRSHGSVAQAGLGLNRRRVGMRLSAAIELRAVRKAVS